MTVQPREPTAGADRGPAYDLLVLLSEGGIRSRAELARRLGIGEALLAMIADDLTRRGYLTAIAMDCSTGCKGCSLASACGQTEGLQKGAPLIALTDKGRRAAT